MRFQRSVMDWARCWLAGWIVLAGMQAVTAYAAEDCLEVIPTEAALGLTLDLQQILASSEWELYPYEIVEEAFHHWLHLDPRDVEQLVLVAGPPTRSGTWPWGVAVTCRDSAIVEQAVQLEPEAGDQADLRRAKAGDRRFLMGVSSMVAQMQRQLREGQPGSVAEMLKTRAPDHPVAAAVNMVALWPALTAHFEAESPLPPQVADLPGALEELKGVRLELRIDPRLRGQLIFDTTDPDSARRLQEVGGRVVELNRQMLLSRLQQSNVPDQQTGAIERGMQRYSRRILEGLFRSVEPECHEGHLQISFASQANLAQMGSLISAALPTIEVAREAMSAHRSDLRLRQLGLVVQSYVATFQTLPPRASYDHQGKPLLSWRVHLLPFLEEAELYRQFHLDEPWNSPHNLQLLPRMPQVFAGAEAAIPLGHTRFQVPYGKGTVFAGKEGLPLARVTDGASQTILLLEVPSGRAIEWTRPEDWEIQSGQPLAGFATETAAAIHVLMVDGSVRRVLTTQGDEYFRGLLSPDGSEGLNSSKGVLAPTGENE